MTLKQFLAPIYMQNHFAQETDIKAAKARRFL